MWKHILENQFKSPHCLPHTRNLVAPKTIAVPFFEMGGKPTNMQFFWKDSPTWYRCELRGDMSVFFFLHIGLISYVSCIWVCFKLLLVKPTRTVIIISLFSLTNILLLPTATILANYVAILRASLGFSNVLLFQVMSKTPLLSLERTSTTNIGNALDLP